jgi:hypothetical protein
MEPTLESISDYNQLKGEKRKVVWSVVIIGILIGIGYLIAYKVFNDSGDAIKINDTIKVVPLSKNIPLK